MERKTNNKWIGKAAVVGLIVLGLFPITAKKLLALYKRKFMKAPENTPVEKKSTHGHWKGEAHV